MLRQLLADISAGKLAAGTRLLPERELGERFGISRGSVRRVLADLRHRGLIVQTVGSGTFVADDVKPGAEQACVAPLGATSPADLMEARLLIEPLFPTLIARNANSDDFARMRACIEGGETATTFEAFQYWDGELHKTLAQATHNAFFLGVLDLMNRIREQPDWEQLKRRSLTPARRVQYEQQHRDIVNALEQRDAARARECLLAHLHQIRGNLFENLSGPQP